MVMAPWLRSYVCLAGDVYGTGAGGVEHSGAASEYDWDDVVGDDGCVLLVVLARYM